MNSYIPKFKPNLQPNTVGGGLVSDADRQVMIVMDKFKKRIDVKIDRNGNILSSKIGFGQTERPPTAKLRMADTSSRASSRNLLKSPASYQ